MTTTFHRGDVRTAKAIRELRALDADYRYTDWKQSGDIFAVTYDGDLSTAWLATGPDGYPVSMWAGKDIELID